MCTVPVEPENGLIASCCHPVDRQLNPVFNRCAAGRRHAPDIACCDAMRMQYIAVPRDYGHDAVVWNFKGCRVRPVLFRFLCHQAYVLHCTRCHRIKRTVGFAEIHRSFIDWRI